MPWHSPAQRESRGAVNADKTSFITECAMHFMADDSCKRNGNWFAYTTRTILVVRSLVAVVLAIYSAGGSTEGEIIARQAASEAMGALVNETTDSAIKTIEDKASETLKNTFHAEQFYKSIGAEAVQQQFVDGLNRGPHAISNKFNGAIKP